MTEFDKPNFEDDKTISWLTQLAKSLEKNPKRARLIIPSTIAATLVAVLGALETVHLISELQESQTTKFTTIVRDDPNVIQQSRLKYEVLSANPFITFIDLADNYSVGVTDTYLPDPTMTHYNIFITDKGDIYQQNPSLIFQHHPEMGFLLNNRPSIGTSGTENIVINIPVTHTNFENYYPNTQKVTLEGVEDSVNAQIYTMTHEIRMGYPATSLDANNYLKSITAGDLKKFITLTPIN